MNLTVASIRLSYYACIFNWEYNLRNLIYKAQIKKFQTSNNKKLHSIQLTFSYNYKSFLIYIIYYIFFKNYNCIHKESKNFHSWFLIIAFFQFTINVERNIKSRAIQSSRAIYILNIIGEKKNNVIAMEKTIEVRMSFASSSHCWETIW